MSAEADKAIADMTHEEALAALPQLREEASRANARVHEAMDRVAQTDEVPTHVDVHGDHLVVSVRGKELAMTFLSDLVIHLKDETYDRLVVEVQDPDEVVTKVNEALDAARRS